MRRTLLKTIREPKTGELLNLIVFKSKMGSTKQQEDVVEGILYNEKSYTAFPIINGVPVMLESAFPKEFIEKYSHKISNNEKLSQIQFKSKHDSSWSFSKQWKHFDSEINISWGYTVEERVAQFLLETQVDNSWCKDKVILDAGCGNGSLSEGISKLGAEVIGIDYSSSVFQAELSRNSELVHFINGDLQNPPFEANSFDLVTSIGVLHHTPNTYNSFVEVAKLVKPGGIFYLWLYRKPEQFHLRYLKYPIFDLIRLIVSRLPNSLQAIFVKPYAGLVKSYHKIKDPSYKDIPFYEYVVSAYDDFTPRWRHYHTPIEVSTWFYENGFSVPSLSHWDNPYGFGMVAKKIKQSRTPGIHYGRSAKLWDSKQTIKRLKDSG